MNTKSFHWILIVQYNGSPYHGFQAVSTDQGVQNHIEKALLSMLGENIRITASGRTDSGVHALAQVIDFSTNKDVTAYNLVHGLNFHLKNQAINIRGAFPVTKDFSARFSATARSYLYRIQMGQTPCLFRQSMTWHVKRELDIDAMQKAASLLTGHHDFTSFRASECQAQSPVKTLDILTVEHMRDEVLIYAKARSFLHHQIRNFAGTLYEVGIGRIRPDYIPTILKARDRSQAGRTAPACGLCFLRPYYEDNSQTKYMNNALKELYHHYLATYSSNNF